MRRRLRHFVLSLSVLVVVFLFALLIYFTFYGGEIYEKRLQQVETVRTNKQYLDQHTLIPTSALTEEGTIYIVVLEQGFSRTIYRLHEQEAKDVMYIEDLSMYAVDRRSVEGMLLVTDAETVKAMGLRDGDKVLIKR